MNRNSSHPDQPAHSGSDSYRTDSFADGAQMPLPDTESTPAERPGREVEPHQDTAAVPAPAPVEPADKEKPKVRGSVAAGTWAALILGAILLILLLVFILQNQAQVDINLFAWSFQLPAGIAYLFSAIIGALIMALVGGLRMLELRRQVKKARR